ncbi:hypothetical protein, partial [Streptococcus pneumoniae]|uniref:hypothetical protein n=2 Tax=Streptococcus pneumoniae TaxID=1313 RepID=UPI001C9910F4
LIEEKYEIDKNTVFLIKIYGICLKREIRRGYLPVSNPYLFSIDVCALLHINSSSLRRFCTL